VTKWKYLNFYTKSEQKEVLFDGKYGKIGVACERQPMNTCRLPIVIQPRKDRF
jgi:hypothetical protein